MVTTKNILSMLRTKGNTNIGKTTMTELEFWDMIKEMDKTELAAYLAANADKLSTFELVTAAQELAFFVLEEDDLYLEEDDEEDDDSPPWKESEFND